MDEKKVRRIFTPEQKFEIDHGWISKYQAIAFLIFSLDLPAPRKMYFSGRALPRLHKPRPLP